jgi:hypothetical protein
MKTKTLSSIGGFAVGVATLSLAFVPSQQAQAANIGLFNTGAGIADGAVDTHYSLISAPAGAATGTTTYRIAGHPNWLQNSDSPSSAWIGGTPNALNNQPAGDYTYRTTFNLSSLAASSASITGKWLADNSALGISLNGSARSNPGGGFGAFGSKFDLTSGFQAGINTLDFIVNNATNNSNTNNPTGLRVELSGTYADPAASAVPEPSDLVGTAFAIGSVVLLKRKLSPKADKLDRVSI